MIEIIYNKHPELASSWHQSFMSLFFLREGGEGACESDHLFLLSLWRLSNSAWVRNFLAFFASFLELLMNKNNNYINIKYVTTISTTYNY